MCSRRWSRSATRWAAKSRLGAKPGPDSMITVAPAPKQVTIARTAGAGSASAAGTINSAQPDVARASARVTDASPPRPASAHPQPESDSGRAHCSRRSSRTRRGRVATGRGRSSGRPAVREPATQPRNPLRLIPISQPTGDEAVHGLGGVVELLVRRLAVARLPFRHQPALVPDPGQRGPECGPGVVAPKQIRVHALVAAAPALFHHVLPV